MKVSFIFVLDELSLTSTMLLSTVSDLLIEIPAAPRTEKERELSVVDDLVAESAVVAYSILFTTKGLVEVLSFDFSLSTQSELILNL